VQPDGKRNGRAPLHLGYPFTPTPRWLLQAFRAGELEHKSYVLLSSLYDRAPTKALAREAEGPRLTLEALHKLCRWPGDLRSLANQLRRLRARGFVNYRTEGNHRLGCVYVFRLLSMHALRTLGDEPQSGTGSGIEASGDE
jgi:hypothetical protein